MVGYREIGAFCIILSVITTHGQIGALKVAEKTKKTRTESLDRTMEQMIKSLPKMEQIEQVQESIRYINSKLSAGESAGRPAFGTLWLHMKSLDDLSSYEGLIEDWFEHYADIEPLLTEWLYKLKPRQVWCDLFSQKYDSLNNSRVRYLMRSYAFSESLSLGDIDFSATPNYDYDLSVRITHMGNPTSKTYKILIENISDDQTWIIPQTYSVETEWERLDSVPLPRGHSPQFMKDHGRVGVVFLRPKDVLVRELKLHVSTRDNLFTSPQDIISTKSRGFSFINRVCLSKKDESVELNMNVILPPFSGEEVTALNEKLVREHGSKAKNFLILDKPIRSGPTRIFLNKGNL